MKAEDKPHSPQSPGGLIHDHTRVWQDCRYVYPVISRRSGGLSVGINVNLDKACNFNCIYCQVDRRDRAAPEPMDLALLRDELDGLLADIGSGGFWRQPKFAATDAAYRRLDNIAISGDGEPTLCRQLEAVVAVVCAVKTQHGRDDVKLVLITNGAGLDREPVKRSLEKLDRCNGEVWAKLDAGSASLYRAINRSAVPFESVVRSLAACGRQRPIVLQTMLLSRAGQPIGDDDFEDYADCVARLLKDGCRVRAIQLYTVARPPAETGVSAMSDAEMDRRGAQLRRRFVDVPVTVYYGA